MVGHRLWLAITALAIVGTGNVSVRGEDDPQPKAPATEKEAAAKPADPYAVPEGNDPKVLQLFLGRVLRTPPKDRTEAAQIVRIEKIEKVMDELLTREIEDSMLMNVVGFKMQAVTALSQQGDPEATKRRAAFLSNALKDKRPVVVEVAKQFQKMDQIQGIARLKKVERTALILQLGKEIQSGELAEDEIQSAITAVEMLAEGKLSEEVDAACKLFAEQITANGHTQAAKIASMFEGTARRLLLLGNEMKITGSTFAGKPFDLASLKGKVVLVDFWATWCGPCRGEIPNMQEQYALYHDKGFEIVGISIDDDRAALEEFLASEKLPWIQLHNNDGTGQHPNADHYAISGIPACFLIDQSGKVVSLNCRGPVLPAMLEELLGPAEKKLTVPDEKPAPEKKE